MSRHGATDIHPTLRQLSGLSEEDLAVVWAAGRVVNIPEGWSMILERTPPDNAYLILEGRVGVRLRNETVTELGPGEFVGEIAPIAHRLRTATCTALTPLHTLDFPAEEFARLRAEVPHFDDAVEAVAAARLAEIDAK